MCLYQSYKKKRARQANPLFKRVFIFVINYWQHEETATRQQRRHLEPFRFKRRVKCQNQDVMLSIEGKKRVPGWVIYFSRPCNCL